MGIEVKSFRKFQKGTLLGFGTIFLSGAGLEIRDVSLHTKDGQKWVAMPSKQYKGEDGSTKYAPLVKIPDKTRWAKFQQEAVGALEEHLSHDQTPAEVHDDDIPF
jgi:hypothetical protein